MLFTWVKTWLGLPVSSEELQYVSESAAVEIGAHVTLRSIQTGSVFGVGVLGPIMAAFEPNFHIFTVARLAGRCGKAAAMADSVVGPLLTWYVVKDMTVQDKEDWCLSMRREERQLAVDRFSVAGFGAGYLIGKVVRKTAAHFGVVGLVGGLIIGEHLYPPDPAVY